MAKIIQFTRWVILRTLDGSDLNCQIPLICYKAFSFFSEVKNEMRDTKDIGQLLEGFFRLWGYTFIFFDFHSSHWSFKRGKSLSHQFSQPLTTRFVFFWQPTNHKLVISIKLFVDFRYISQILTQQSLSIIVHAQNSIMYVMLKSRQCGVTRCRCYWLNMLFSSRFSPTTPHNNKTVCFHVESATAYCMSL
jgi:hypothetical protein